LKKQVLFQTILKKYSTESTKKIIHHLSWGIESNSRKIINLLMTTLKENIRDINAVNHLLSNISGLLEIDDSLKSMRIRLLFALDDQYESENDSIFNYLLSFRDDMILITLICLKLLGENILKYNDSFQYVMNYINKLEWIFYFIRDINNDSLKKDNLQIEASADGINFLDLMQLTQEIYYDKFKLRQIVMKNQGSNNNINNNNNNNNNYHHLMDHDQDMNMENVQKDKNYRDGNTH